jgi:hypothetical protein
MRLARQHPITLPRISLEAVLAIGIMLALFLLATRALGLPL